MCIIFFLAGAIAMYWIKDNFAKPDNQTNIDVDLKVKKNKLFNRKTKIRRKLFKRNDK